jgi:hypothetical protein
MGSQLASLGVGGGGGASSLLTGLIGYWKLDEASGTRNDAHGSNHLTDNGSVGSNTGKLGNAADLDGVNDSLILGDNADLSTGDIDFTWTCWMYLDTKPTGNNAYAIHKQDEYGLLYRDYGGHDRLAFLVNDGAVIVNASTLGSPSTGTWYFIVCWHDATANTINIQVNDGTVDSAATAGTAPSDTANEFQLGRYTAGTPLRWDGRLDGVGFWKRVLTATERSNLYNSGSGLEYPF